MIMSKRFFTFQVPELVNMKTVRLFSIFATMKRILVRKPSGIFLLQAMVKRPSDGVGGTIKREAAEDNLRRPYDNQIITPPDLFNFAVEN